MTCYFDADPATNPMMNETREQMIARWEKDKILDPNCPECKRYYNSKEKPSHVPGPRHEASQLCQSGRRPHCTCDACY